MITHSEFQVVAVQASVFTPDAETFSASGLLASVLSEASARYDGDPVSVPIPSGAPPEVPRVILQSRDGAWRLQASPVRVDSHCCGVEGDWHAVVRECAEHLLRYVADSERLVTRLALLVTRTAVADDPAGELVRSFCNDGAQDGPLRRSCGFELHNYKRYTVPGTPFVVNSWVRCKTGFLTRDGSSQPAIVVEQDLNTPADPPVEERFEVARAREFFSVLPTEADAILKVYFPSEA